VADRGEYREAAGAGAEGLNAEGVEPRTIVLADEPNTKPTQIGCVSVCWRWWFQSRNDVARGLAQWVCIRIRMSC
jgi:hypothetical protein